MRFIHITSLGLLALLASGCAAGARVNEPVRAVWVTRWDFKKAEDIPTIMKNCADAGFNAVLFQVRGNGTAFYDSPYEPWAEEFDFKDPGFDPLEVACREAKAKNLDLHAWINVMPGWRGPKEPADKNQLYHTHPNWFWYDKDGVRQPLNHKVRDKQRGWYVSVNPCLPEVRTYLADLSGDIAKRYDIDGLHLDYIRYPREPVLAGEVVPDYPRDERTVALYKAETGLTPDEDAEKWHAWRTEQVNQLVRDIHQSLHQAKPKAVLTAAIGSNPEHHTSKYFQDARTWMQRDIIDGIVLMNYTDDPKVFAERIEPWVEYKDKTPVIPGFWFGTHAGKSPREAAEMVRQQIEIANNKTGNFCAFAYSNLFRSPNEELKEKGKETAQSARQDVLVPYIKSLPTKNESN